MILVALLLAATSVDTAQHDLRCARALMRAARREARAEPPGRSSFLIENAQGYYQGRLVLEQPSFTIHAFDDEPDAAPVDQAAVEQCMADMIDVLLPETKGR